MGNDLHLGISQRAEDGVALTRLSEPIFDEAVEQDIGRRCKPQSRKSLGADPPRLAFVDQGDGAAPCSIGDCRGLAVVQGLQGFALDKRPVDRFVAPLQLYRLDGPVNGQRFEPFP